MQNAVLEALKADAYGRRAFGEWMRGASRVSIPLAAERNREGDGDTRLYARLMSSVDPTHHDVPLFLHCLTEQVELSLAGDAQAKEDEVAHASLQKQQQHTLD